MATSHETVCKAASDATVTASDIRNPYDLGCENLYIVAIAGHDGGTLQIQGYNLTVAEGTNISLSCPIITSAMTVPANIIVYYYAI